MSSELLTVVIPTRDRPDFLELALRSVVERQETIPKIIVSDNSTRDLPELEVLRRKYGFSYVRQSGQLSMFDHHNACLRLPSTPWAFLLHDDDELSPNIVRKLESLAKSSDAGAIVGGIEYIDENSARRGSWLPDREGNFKGEEIVLHLGLDYRVCPPGILWNLAACRELGGFPLAHGNPNEQALLLHLAFSYGVVLVPQMMGRFRVWANQTTNLSTPERAEYMVGMTIEGAQSMREIGLSRSAADQLLDYQIWWIFRYATPLFSKHPFFVSRLCRKCEIATPPNGVWRARVRSEYPFLFWKPRRLATLFVVMAMTFVPGPIRRALNRATGIVGAK